MSGKQAKKLRKIRKDEGEQTFKMQRFAAQTERRHEMVRATGDLRYLSKDVKPHYHLMFNTQPNMKEGFETQALAFQEMQKVADAHEPNVIYYEEGMIQLTSARLPDRTGHFQIMLQVGECYAPCQNVRQVRVQSASPEKILRW